MGALPEEARHATHLTDYGFFFFPPPSPPSAEVCYEEGITSPEASLAREGSRRHGKPPQLFIIIICNYYSLCNKNSGRHSKEFLSRFSLGAAAKTLQRLQYCTHTAINILKK